MRSARKPLTLALASLTALVMTGCTTAPPIATETEKALCDELRRDLPTFSLSEDSRVTAESVARFRIVFDELCPLT